MSLDEEIKLVRINTQEPKEDSDYTDEEIGLMLKANNHSVNFVSYRICMLKSRDDSVTLGPISVKSNSEYWLNLAEMYLQLHQQEQNEDANNKNRGGTIYMQRADETWQ